MCHNSFTWPSKHNNILTSRLTTSNCLVFRTFGRKPFTLKTLSVAPGINETKFGRTQAHTYIHMRFYQKTLCNQYFYLIIIHSYTAHSNLIPNFLDQPTINAPTNTCKHRYIHMYMHAYTYVYVYMCIESDILNNLKTSECGECIMSVIAS